MSIILNALKKVQNQEADRGSAGARDASDDKRSAAADTSRSRGIFRSAPTVPAGQTGFSAAGDAAEIRHRFGMGPTVLLGLIVLLGVFTTGWFVGRIYLGAKPVSEATVAEAIPETVEPPKIATAAQAPSVEPAIAEPEQEPPPAMVESAPVAETPVPRPPAPEPPVVVTSVAAPPPRPVEPALKPAREEIIVYVPKLVAEEPAPAPIKEPRTVEKGRPEFKINAIAWRSEEPRAVVNMQSVYEGDVIEGATVLAIRRMTVVLEYEGETFELRF